MSLLASMEKAFMAAGPAERIVRGAEEFSAWLDEHGAWFVAAFTAIYFPVAILLARRKPFWYDELFTYYIASVPELRSILEILKARIDHHPPEFFLLTRAAALLPVSPHISFRLPEMAGVWLACVCVFLFIRNRTNAVYGAAAALLVVVLEKFDYAIEARPYGLILGFSALALLAWQQAGSGERHRAWCFLLAVATGAAVSSHYYSVLVFTALIAGEAARSLERRKVDFLIWLALLTGAAVAALHLPLVVNSVSGFARKNWANPYAAASIDIYRSLIVEISGPLVVCLIAAILCIAIGTRSWPASRTLPGLPPGDAAAACIMLLQPVIGHAVAVLVTNKIYYSYVIGVVIGFAIVAVLVAYYASSGSTVFGTVLLVVLAAACAVQVYSLPRVFIKPLPSGILSTDRTLPLVIDDPLRALKQWHYEQSEIKGRLRYLVDRESSLRFGAVPSGGTGLITLREYVALPVDTLQNFQAHHKRFFLFTNQSDRGWVLQKYVADGAVVRLLWAEGKERIYIVEAL